MKMHRTNITLVHFHGKSLGKYNQHVLRDREIRPNARELRTDVAAHVDM